MIDTKKMQKAAITKIKTFSKQFVFLLSLVAASSALAANIRDIDIHEAMYLQGLFSDDLVYVMRIDYSRNRVKVQNSEDGTAKWVDPSRLISKDASITNDIGRGVALIALLACAADPEACTNNNNASTRRSNTQATSSATAYKFKVTNKCRHPIKLALNYRKANGNWSTNGWWSIGGNRSTYLDFSDGSYATSSNSSFFYYTKTEDNKIVWSGDHNATFNGVTLPMKKVVDKEGDSEWTLNCNGL